MTTRPRIRFALLLVLSSCGGPRDVEYFQTVQAAPGFPGDPGDEAAFATWFDFTPVAGCDPIVSRMLNRRTEVRVFLGNGITENDGLSYARGLQRYYAHYGVQMFTRYAPVSVPLDHAMVMNDDAIVSWMRENTSVDPNSQPIEGTAAYTAYLRAVGGAMYFNVKQFLRAYAEPNRTVINLVLLKRVAALNPSDEAALDAWGVAGLGLSEELLVNLGEDGVQMRTIIDESDFSPTVFISVHLIDYLMKYPDIVVAHEFGHTYGLTHTTTETNLMYGSAEVCDASLSSSQITTIEQNSARYGNVVDLSAYSPLEFLSWSHRAPESTKLLLSRLQGRGSR